MCEGVDFFALNETSQICKPLISFHQGRIHLGSEPYRLSPKMTKRQRTPDEIPSSNSHPNSIVPGVAINSAGRRGLFRQPSGVIGLPIHSTIQVLDHCVTGSVFSSSWPACNRNSDLQVTSSLFGDQWQREKLRI